jgi:hypothetical protein
MPLLLCGLVNIYYLSLVISGIIYIQFSTGACLILAVTHVLMYRGMGDLFPAVSPPRSISILMSCYASKAAPPFLNLISLSLQANMSSILGSASVAPPTPVVFGENHAIPFTPRNMSFLLPLTSTSEPDNGGVSTRPTASNLRQPISAGRVAGSRVKMSVRKGKMWANSLELHGPGLRRGHPHGSSNFTDRDLSALLDATAMVLPLGERGWKTVTEAYNLYARHHGRLQRTHRSLTNKFCEVR